MVKSSISTNIPLPYLAATGARTTSKSSGRSAEDHPTRQSSYCNSWRMFGCIIAILPSLGLSRDMIATGCEDKNVRVYYLATSSEQPLKVFTGHLAKVFHVRWSPLREGILCSGSDDGWVSPIFCKTMHLQMESLQHDSSTQNSLIERSVSVADKCPRVYNQLEQDFQQTKFPPIIFLGLIANLTMHPCMNFYF